MGLIYFNRKPLFLEHKKRYVLIFNKFIKDKLISKSITEYDDLKEANEEITMINEFYKDEPRPILVEKGISYRKYDFDNGGFFWGYVLLDFEEEKILKWGNDCLYSDIEWKKCDKLFLKDYFFRKKDEIPENYKFDRDEFAGWLIYRWNRGHYDNLYGLTDKQPKEKTKEPTEEEFEVSPLTNEEIIEEDFDKEYDKYLLKKFEDRW